MREPGPVCVACGHDLLLHLFTVAEQPCRALMYVHLHGAACVGICGCPQFQRSQVAA